MSLSKNDSVTYKRGNWAPIYDPRRRNHYPVRIAKHAALRAMPNGAPFFIPLFDTTSLFASSTPQGVLPALGSYENNFQMTVDFWWLMTTASYSAGSAASPPFAWQLFSAVANPDGTPGASKLYQKTPIPAACGFGTAQEPFELTEPVHLPMGTELICSVQNLQNASNTIQIVLMGYLVDDAGGSK